MRILIIEDEEKLAESLKKGLEKSGYAVDCLTDGEAGLRRIETTHANYDLIILDLMLPKKSGFEVCSALKKDPQFARIPVIIFTGKGQEMDEKLCRELGANAYITKPHGSKEIIEQIEALLANVLPDQPE